MSPQVHVAGRCLSLLAPVSGMVLGAEFGVDQICGPSDASFNVWFGVRQRPDWLKKDAPAFVSYGGRRLLTGTVSEVDWSDGSVTVLGASHDGDHAPALFSGETTSTPDLAVANGISEGWLSWTPLGSLGASALTTGDVTEQVNDVASLLAATSTATNRPTVMAAGFATIGADPVAPQIYLVPGVGELSWSSDAQADCLVGRWADATGALQTTVVGSGRLVQAVDLTSLGLIDSTRATAVLTAILADLSAGGWTGGLTVAAEQIVGGLSLAYVYELAGQGLMARSHGQRDPRPGRSVGFVDFITERAEWHVDDAQIVLTPRGMVARDLAAVLADQGVAAA